MAAVTTNTNFSDEVLNYVITYKWGIIQKESGDATLSLKNKGSNYKIVLTGKTRPWPTGFTLCVTRFWQQSPKRDSAHWYIRKWRTRGKTIAKTS